MVMTVDRGDSRRSVLTRVFEILDCFADGEPEQTLSTLCARTGLPPATMHRMLTHLTTWGAVERTARGRYRLGMRLWRLGWGVPEARVLKDVARPRLVDLHVETGAVAMLVSRDGDAMVVADAVAGADTSGRFRLPRQLPLVGSAPGTVWLAHLPAAEAEALTRRAGYASDFAQVRRLAEIRRRGIALERSSGPRSGLVWVAAPVFDDARMLRSTICVAAPERDLAESAVASTVRFAADQVSAGLLAAVQDSPA